MNQTVVSEISIVPIKSQNGLVAFADCVIDNKFYIGGIGVYTMLNDPGEFRLVYPTKALRNGKQLPVFHPINNIAGQDIQQAISNEVKRLFSPVEAKYDQ